MTDEDRAQWQQYRQELFNHLAENHDLHLLESELDEIERIVARKPTETYGKIDQALAHYMMDHGVLKYADALDCAREICLLFAPSIAEVVAENDKLRKRVKQLEAACAAMREIAEDCLKQLQWVPDPDTSKGVHPCQTYKRNIQRFNAINAGTEFLKRLQKAETK